MTADWRAKDQREASLEAEAVRQATRTVPVTVLMPAYNAARTLEAAIQSICAQTFPKWRLLIVDDGSTDATGDICRQWMARDSRILYWRAPHQGLIRTLNLGLWLIESRYVARLDADDIAYPQRLEKQLAFLEKHPQVKVLGTNGYRVNDKGRKLSQILSAPASWEAYEEHRRARKLFFLLHSSVVAEREVVLAYGGYREEDYPAEDTALWTRIAQHHPVMVLPEPLVDYRISGTSISGSSQKRMILQFWRLEHNLRTGESLSLEEFQQRLARQPWRWLRLHLGVLHKGSLRAGAYHFFNGDRLRGAILLAMGALLDPWDTAQRLIRRA